MTYPFGLLGIDSPLVPYGFRLSMPVFQEHYLYLCSWLDR